MSPYIRGFHEMNVKDVLMCVFIFLYAAIQYYVIHHPGVQDDAISARMQDIMILVVSSYFGKSK